MRGAAARAVEAELTDEETAAELAYALWQWTGEGADRDRARARYARLLEESGNPALVAVLEKLDGAS